MALASLCFILFSAFAGAALNEPKVLRTVKPLPVALDRDFEFRKARLYLLTEKPIELKREKTSKKVSKLDEMPSSRSTTVAQDASISFERSYRLFGAVTKLDQHQRFGNYFDFFWRARRPADLTMRFEYRQEKLHAHVQAQEISYGNIRGNRKTEFKVVGDDYFDGGRVLAWRCLLIENGKVVAENRSFLWE